jgi:hypothetical protein
MKKRPALLSEARAIVQAAKAAFERQAANPSMDPKVHAWKIQTRTGKVHSLWMCNGRSIAVPNGFIDNFGRQRHTHRRVMTIIGTDQFDTTQFVGNELFQYITRRSEDIDLALAYHMTCCRVSLIEKNGHPTWRVVLVEQGKGKDIYEVA